MRLALPLLLCAVATAAAGQPLGDALSVYQVIAGQSELKGKRVVIQGRISECHRQSCVLFGDDPQGLERFLSIGRSASFDVAVRGLGGRTVEIEARVQADCMPFADPEILPVCADRSDTLADPKLVRVL